MNHLKMLDVEFKLPLHGFAVWLFILVIQEGSKMKPLGVTLMSELFFGSGVDQWLWTDVSAFRIVKSNVTTESSSLGIIFQVFLDSAA